MFLCAGGIVIGCERSCICLLVESLLPLSTILILNCSDSIVFFVYI